MERVLRMRDRRRALRVVRGSMWQRSEKVYLGESELEFPDHSYLLREISQFSLKSTKPRNVVIASQIVINVVAIAILALIAMPFIYYAGSYINLALEMLAKSYNRAQTAIDPGEIWASAHSSSSAFERYLALFPSPAIQVTVVVLYMYFSSYILVPLLLQQRLTLVMKSGEKVVTQYQPAPLPIIFAYPRFTSFIRAVRRRSKKALKEHIIEGGVDEYGYSSALYATFLRWANTPYLLALISFSGVLPLSFMKDSQAKIELLTQGAIYLLLVGFVAKRRLLKTAQALDKSYPSLISTRISRLLITAGWLALPYPIIYLTPDEGALIAQAMIVVLVIYAVLRPLEKMLRNKS